MSLEATILVALCILLIVVGAAVLAATVLSSRISKAASKREKDGQG